MLAFPESRRIAIEIKSGATITGDSVRSLERFQERFPGQSWKKLLVYGGSETTAQGSVFIRPVEGISPFLDEHGKPQDG